MVIVLEKSHCIDCGKPISKTAKRCLSCANSGKNNPIFGLTGINNPRYGKIASKETKKKMSLAHSGKNNHMYGKRFYGEANPNYKDGRTNKIYYCKCGKEIGSMTALYGKGKCQDCYQNNKYGSNNPNWKDGLSQIGKRIRSLKVYKEWHEACLERDNYTCQNCGSKENPEVHHKLSISWIIKENDIKNSRMALDYPEFWMLELGITYCFDCHCLFDKARHFIIKRGESD